MASSGTINGADGYKGFKIRIKWSTNSQSVANNSSSVNVGVYLVVPTYYSTSSYMRGSYTVNGETRNINLATATYREGEHLLASDNFTIYHNDDGTKTFNMSATVTSGWTTLGTMPTASGSGTLDTIARASQPSINTYPNNSPDFNIGDTIKIYMNRASNSFTHTVVFNYGSTSVTVATNVADNCTFNTSTIANALYALIPNANVYSGTISVTTYNGSTNIGTKTCAYNAKVTNANPTFNAAYLDTNSTITAITTDNQLIVRNKSTLRINISNAAAQKSATLASARCVILGQTVTATLSGSSVALNVGTINTSQNTTAAVSVIDSRGNSTTINLTITVADWQQPTGIITLARHDNYYSETDIKVDANYSSVNNKNVVTIKVRSKKQTTSTWGAYTTLQDNVTSVLTLDNEYAWDIQVLLTDSFGGSTTYNLTLSRGMPIVFFDRGKSSTGFNCFPNYDQSVEVSGRLFVQNQDILDKFTGIGGTAQAASTSDWNTAGGMKTGIYMGSNMSHAPENSANWFYVLHMVHNANYQRQVAYDFFGIDMWTRRKDNGTWYPWYRIDLTGSTYSTTEARDGTFIDDKPIYKKTINFGSLPNATTKDVAHNIANIDQIVKIEGIAQDTVNPRFIMLPLVYDGNNKTYDAELSVTPTEIRVKTVGDRSTMTAYITIWYTKNEQSEE